MFCEPAFSKMLQKMLMTMSPVASGTSWSYLQSCTVLESDFDSDLDQITLLPSPDNMHNSPLRNFRKNIGWYTSLLLMTLITIILVKYLINVFSFYIAHTLNITFDTSFIWDHIHVQVITFFVILSFVKLDKKFPFKLSSVFNWFWRYSSLKVEKTR